MRHCTHLSIWSSLCRCPEYSFLTMISLLSHLHLSCSTDYKRVTIDKPRVGIKHRTLSIKRVVPSVCFTKVCQSLCRKIRVKLQSGYGLRHHTRKDIPVVKPIQSCHLIPCLLFQRLHLIG